MTGFVLLLLMAVGCGTLVQALAGFTRGAWLLSILTAYVGAIAGYYLGHGLALPYEALRFQIEGRTFPIAWPIMGAVVFPAALNMILYRRTPVR